MKEELNRNVLLGRSSQVKGKDASLPQNRPRLSSLDALRGLVALLIIVIHYTTANWSFPPPKIDLPFPSPMNELTSFMYDGVFGAVGVLLFFLLSGFVFMWNYKDRISEHKIELQEFALLRFSRLYPLCWLTSTLMLILALVEHVAGAEFIYSPYDIIKSYLGFGVYVLDSGTALLNGVTWTLSLEISMYFLFFLITWYAKRRNGILLFIFPILLGILLENLNITNLPILNVNFALVLPSFFMGCLTCEFYKSIHGINKRKVGMVSIAILLLFLLTWFQPGISYYQKTFTSLICVYSLIVLPALVLAVLCITPLSRFLSLKFFQWLGNLSLSIYLIHYPVLSVISTLHLHSIIDFNASNPLNLFFVMIITLILSHFSFYFFERPAQRWIRAKYFSWKASKMKISSEIHK